MLLRYVSRTIGSISAGGDGRFCGWAAAGAAIDWRQQAKGDEMPLVSIRSLKDHQTARRVGEPEKKAAT
jgi:hypothetical protein